MPKLSFATIAFLCILLLAAALRLRGIHWSVPSDELQHATYQPDEAWLIWQMQSIDLFSGKLIAGGYREGNLLYYIWHLLASLFAAFGLMTKYYDGGVYNSRFADILLLGRYFNVAADLGTSWVIYCCVLKLTRAKLAGLFAMFLYAIMPMAVITSDYMRPHIPANLTIVLVTYASLFIFERPGLFYSILLGVLAGVAASARFPFVFIIGVPALYRMIQIIGTSRNETAIGYVKSILTDPNLWAMAIFAIVTFFTINAGFIVDSTEALANLKVQADVVNPAQFHGAGIFDLTLPWRTIVEVTPFGLLPYLWIVLYAGTIYVLALPRYWRYVLPILFCLLVYFIFIAKAYLFGFVRNTIFLFPFMAIFCGLAWHDLSNRLQRYMAVKVILVVIVGVICSASILFDVAYKSAMANGDPRDRLVQDLLATNRQNQITSVCYLRTPESDFSVLYALGMLVKPGIRVIGVPDAPAWPLDYRPDPTECEYFILSAFEHYQDSPLKALAERAIQSGKFSMFGEYRSPIAVGPFIFDSSRFPHDMMYPIPRLYVIKAVRR